MNNKLPWPVQQVLCLWGIDMDSVADIQEKKTKKNKKKKKNTVLKFFSHISSKVYLFAWNLYWVYSLQLSHSDHNYI